MRQPARHESAEALGCRRAHVAQQQLGPRHAERVRHQQFGIEPGGIGDGGEFRSGFTDGLGDDHPVTFLRPRTG